MSFTGDEKEVFRPYQFKMDEIEGFRYRAQVSCERFYLIDYYVAVSDVTAVLSGGTKLN